MPAPSIKALAKKTGKSDKEIEKLWKEAKKITTQEFNKPESKFSDKEWKYTVGILKNMLGISDSILQKFLKSNKSSEDFIETVTSGQFSVGEPGGIIPKKKDDEDDEEIEDDLSIDKGNSLYSNKNYNQFTATEDRK